MAVVSGEFPPSPSPTRSCRMEINHSVNIFISPGFVLKKKRKKKAQLIFFLTRFGDSGFWFIVNIDVDL